MTDQYLASMMDATRNISFESSALLTTSAINALHFPGLSTSGISDSVSHRRTSILLDGLGMCESMTESFCSTGGQDDSLLINSTNILSSDSNTFKLERKDSTTQRKRRSRRSQYDASIDGTSLDKIEAVALIDEQNEPDDVWLFEVPNNGHKNDQNTDNIFSWVHKEFKTNDINASKHRLLCKLDDMSHARTIRSVSCHNFADSQRLDNVKRSFTEQKVHSESIKHGRLSSPLRATTPLFTDNGNSRSTPAAQASPVRPTITVINTNENNNPLPSAVKSQHVSKECEKEPPLDYTDLEVMAKVQLENLRQAERQGPLSKRFGGSNVSLASTSSGTSVSISNRTGTKPPVAPKPAITKNGTRPSTYSRSNTQTIVSNRTNNYDVPMVTESKVLTTRASVLPPNSTNNIRTRPSTVRPIQPYRGSQTACITNAKVQIAPSSVQRKPIENRPLSNGNGLLNDVSNKPLTASIRSQVGPQRRTVLPQSSTYASTEQIIPASASEIRGNRPTTITRSSSSLSQGRKSGIPTTGKPQKPSSATVTRLTTTKIIPFGQPLDSMMNTRILRAYVSNVCPQIPESVSTWDDGCY